jgi:hypothetical protein
MFGRRLGGSWKLVAAIGGWFFPANGALMSAAPYNMKHSNHDGDGCGSSVLSGT